MIIVNKIRRLFLRKSLEGLLIISGAQSAIKCANMYFNPDIDYTRNPEKFDIRAFDAWFRNGSRKPNSHLSGIHRLYNGYNPNHNRVSHNFREANKYGYTPGHSYNFGFGEDMIAMMPGRVARIGSYNTGRAGGKFIAIQSPDIGIGNFTIEYGHLDNIHWQIGDLVKRGEPPARIKIQIV